ncbi:enoyl-CoA hydratase/isomerase family protein [Flavobacterium sp. W21_SRS_FM6]|uniref:enoyl-CoA hydratase/isomerase family protein n=1 Tax=Flavobacterium sp. W21_SRS_FM6 TaxID=3240268 RepID=UPI003F918E59
MKNTYSGLLVNIDERGVAKVTLNRPELHNAFDAQLIADLTEVFNYLGSQPEVRAMILAANGRSFSAGADLNWMQKMADYSYAENMQDAAKLATMLASLNHFSKPTIARVQGAAFGGAIGLIACCDMAVGSKLSKFCLSEVKIGLVPATISPYVISAIGARAARRYFTTAEVFSARRARRLGLLSEAVTEEELDSTIESLIEHILRNSPQAVSAAKSLINHVENRKIDHALIDYTCEQIAHIRVSEEGQEGLQAFLQKRLASWNKASL